MDNRLFVFVLQETESDEWTSGHSLSGILWNVFEMHSNPSPSLAEGTERQLASMNLRKKNQPTDIVSASASARLRTACSVLLKSSNWNIRA